jgi:hypothetical protein
MKDSVRKELKELCYYIIENNNSLARPEQLTRVQMLYERLLVLNYLEELEGEGKTISPSIKKTSPKVHLEEPKENPIKKVSPPEAAVIPAKKIKENEPQLAPRPIEKPRTQKIDPVETKGNSEEAATVNSEAEISPSINDKLAKGAITVGLNDRIAFVKHLFNDSQADFNRVLSQLNTLDSYLESMYFIENLVKPDYDWENKKPYEDRLISLVKKRFVEDW